jgi:hypothetical protein
VDWFPIPSPVVADYKKDTERYAALKVLYDALGAATKGRRSGVSEEYRLFQAFSLMIR